VAQEIDIEISLEGGQKVSPFNYLTISQKMNGHHYFEIRFNHDVLEKRNAVIIESSKNFLGKSITFSFKTKYSSGLPEHIFKGIITEIGIDNNLDSVSDIFFKGHSPTILLEGGEHCFSFLQMTLDQIIKKSTENVPSNLLSTNIQTKFKSTIPYCVQYKESTFSFMNRLSDDYGEPFFYDGTKLFFGKPSGNSTIDIQYPRDISDLSLNVRVTPVTFSNIDYFSKNNEKFVSTSESQKVNLQNKFGDFALKASTNVFQNKSLTLSNKKSISKSENDANTLTQKSSKAAELVYLNASSDNPYIRLGSVLNISADKVEESGDEDFGKYIVINITHSTDGLGNYHNTFEAIPYSLEVFPAVNAKRPVAEQQLAIVKQNKDPDNLGRIKVQFLWQNDNDTTPWIRVMSHHSGTLSSGGKNRGLFFTPEVDDYVIVGFTNNDPDRPFVLGSVSHGKAIDSSENTDNSIKYIRTRSGNTIQFKDNENNKKQEILIQTDDGNLISIVTDNDKGTIKIKSSQAIEIESEKTITIKSEKIDIKGKTISIEGSDKIDIKSKEISINGQSKISIEAGQNLSAKGMEVAIEGSTNTTLKSGAQLEISGGAMANIKAPMVKIN